MLCASDVLRWERKHRGDPGESDENEAAEGDSQRGDAEEGNRRSKNLPLCTSKEYYLEIQFLETENIIE